MIVFNAYAILTAIAVVICSIPVFLLDHFNIINEDLATILISWIALIVSFILSRIGVKGKLFFIPVWILCIPFPFLMTYKAYEWTGIIVTLGSFALIAGIIYSLIYSGEKKKAQEIEYAEIVFPSNDASPLEFWQKAKDLFFMPSMINFTPAICSYNLKIIEKMQNVNIEMKTLPDFKSEMTNGKNSFEQSFKINTKVKDDFFKEIDAYISHLTNLAKKAPEKNVA